MDTKAASVVAQLYESAQRYARRAAAALAAGRTDDAMADAGIALEHIAKAYLASVDLLLIVGTRNGAIDTAGMVWAVGGTKRAAAPGYTIPASEAIRRAGALVPELSGRDLRPVLEARNGLLHIGSAQGTDADAVITSVARAAAVLLPKIGRDAEELWGHFHHAVTGRLDKRRSQVVHRVADKLAAANVAWEETLERVDAVGVQALRQVAERYQLSDAEVALSCPVCDSTAVGSGVLEIEEVPEVDHDGADWFVSGVSLIPWVYIYEVLCGVCGLRLDDEEEVTAAGLPTKVESDQEVDEREYWGVD